MSRIPIDTLAFQLAVAYHEGQKRWDGKPYITHPIAVATKMETPDEIAVAYLHDILEQTLCTTTDLLTAGIPVLLIDKIKLLTHNMNESYEQYINKIRTSKDRVTIEVKKNDILHNLSTLDKIKHPLLYDKYTKALNRLENNE